MSYRAAKKTMNGIMAAWMRLLCHIVVSVITSLTVR